jgi:hypothetical protein
MTRVTASLPSELGAALEQSARANERSLAAEVRLALREHLKAFPLPQGSRGARDESAVTTMAVGSSVQSREGQP